jgi:hypothetical protein
LNNGVFQINDQGAGACLACAGKEIRFGSWRK